MKKPLHFSISIAYLLLLMTISFQCKTSSKSFEKPPMPRDFHEDQKCYHQNKLNPSERAQIYPFSKAKSIKVIAFPSQLGKTPISNDTLIPSKILESVELTNRQRDQLTDILYNYNYSKKTNVFIETSVGCYFPRHAIVFLNPSNKVIAFIELCLECKKNVTTLPNESIGAFCEGKYELLHQFFTSIGIKHFRDDSIKN